MQGRFGKYEVLYTISFISALLIFWSEAVWGQDLDSQTTEQCRSTAKASPFNLATFIKTLNPPTIEEIDRLVPTASAYPWVCLCYCCCSYSLCKSLLVLWRYCSFFFLSFQ